MADLYPLFMDHYLHKTDSDIVKASETKGIANKTISNLLGTQTSRCQEVLNSMDADSQDNIVISARNNSKEVYNLTLNTKVTHGKSIQLYKRQLEKARIDVINCTVDNIGDQLDSCTLMFFNSLLLT